MIDEKILRAGIGWLFATTVFAMYFSVPVLEMFVNVDVSNHTSVALAFSSVLFLDAAKPAKQWKYKSFWLDVWLSLTGWICTLAFAWFV